MNASTQESATGVRYPPVSELVIGVRFGPLAGARVQHLLALWEHYRTAFPVLEQPGTNLPPVVSVFPGLLVPECPRVWFMQTDKRLLLQLQPDAFMMNWRRIEDSDPYPGYANLSRAFMDYWMPFESSAREIGLGEVNLTQLELTYIDLFPVAESADQLRQVGRFFPHAYWSHETRPECMRDPVGLDLNLAFRVPAKPAILSMRVAFLTRQDGDREPTRMQMATSVKTPVGECPPHDDILRWFDEAHEAVAAAFQYVGPAVEPPGPGEVT